MSFIGALIGWIVFGLVVGLIARLIYPGRQDMGWGMTTALGVVGSFLGGLVSWAIWGGEGGRYNPAGWILSIIGAFVVLWAYVGSRRRKVHP